MTYFASLSSNDFSINIIEETVFVIPVKRRKCLEPSTGDPIDEDRIPGKKEIKRTPKHI